MKRHTFLLSFLILGGLGFAFAQSANITSSIAPSQPSVFQSSSVVSSIEVKGATSLSFEEAVEQGMQHNLDLLAAKYNIPLAEADELTAGLWNNPSLLVDTVFEPFGRNWNQTNAGGPRQFDLQISYPLDLSGKIRTAKRSAHKATEVAKATFQDAMRQKLRDIRLAYIDVITFQQQLALAQEKKNSLQELLDVIQARVGVSANLPLLKLRAQLARDQAELDRRQREIALRAARTNLAVLLGFPRRTLFKLVTPLRDFKTPNPPSLDELVSSALESRPDLQALKLSFEKAKLDRKAAVAQRWDNFTYMAGLSSQGPDAANPNDPSSGSLKNAESWGMSLTIPLPFFNRNQGNIRKAEHSAEQTQKEIDSLTLSISQEIEGVYDQLNLNRGLIVDYESGQLDNARKVRDEQQRLVGMGSNALLDYFDAVGAYASAVSAYYDAVGEYRRDVARLNAACAKDVMS